MPSLGEVSVTHGMDTSAGLQASQELERGSHDIADLATRLELALQSFDWMGTDADRVRQSWTSIERPSLDTVNRQIAALSVLIRLEAEAQDTTSGELAVAGGRSGVPRVPVDMRATLVREAVTAGLTSEALRRYTERLQQLTPEQVAALDPSTFRGTVASQPDGTTCGSSSLVMSRMENDPAYAMSVLTGYDPTTGTTHAGTRGERFAAESLAMHERTNGWFDRDGDLQSAWPESLGTAPGPLANEMSSVGGSGVPGTTYEVDWVRYDSDRGVSFDQIVTASQNGHTVKVYVGDGMPRHVVLATATDGNTLTFYEPGRGETVTVTLEQWMNDQVGLGGWNSPWAIVTPRH